MLRLLACEGSCLFNKLSVIIDQYKCLGSNVYWLCVEYAAAGPYLVNQYLSDVNDSQLNWVMVDSNVPQHHLCALVRRYRKRKRASIGELKPQKRMCVEPGLIYADYDRRFNAISSMDRLGPWARICQGDLVRICSPNSKGTDVQVINVEPSASAACGASAPNVISSQLAAPVVTVRVNDSILHLTLHTHHVRQCHVLSWDKNHWVKFIFRPRILPLLRESCPCTWPYEPN